MEKRGHHSSSGAPVRHGAAAAYSQVDVFDLEVDADCGDECLREGVVRVAQQQARLTHACPPREAEPGAQRQRRRGDKQ